MTGLRIGLRLSGFLSLVVVLAPLQAVLLFVPRLWTAVPLLFFKLMLKVMGVRLAVTGPLPARGSLIVANHLSWFDIVVIGSLLPVSFVAKSEVKSWPLFGQLAMLQKTVFVDRRRGRHNKTDGNALAARLQRGDTVVIFAEGTNSDGIRVLPFKSTLLAGLAGMSAVPVQAMSMAYSRAHGMAMGRRQRIAYAWLGDISLLPHLFFMLASPPITVDVVFHEVLPAAARGDRKIMARTLHDQVARGLEAINRGSPQALAAPPQKL